MWTQSCFWSSIPLRRKYVFSTHNCIVCRCYQCAAFIMICAVWPAAECELSAAGNFRWRSRVNVRDNTVADRQAVWSLWLLALLIETDALLSWGTLWQMEAEIHKRLGNTQGGSLLSAHHFWSCVSDVLTLPMWLSPRRLALIEHAPMAWWLISKWLRYFKDMKEALTQH